MPKLYLIPNLLSDSPWQKTIPDGIASVIEELTCFIVEDVRNARRFLKKISPQKEIDSLTFLELNNHTSPLQKQEIMETITGGIDTGIISEAGCPGIADPGSDIVRLAHQRNIQVIPLTGPSSILLALIASGLNGQHFAFSGYLPVKPAERIRMIQSLEKRAISQHQTQIFMETPYRNNQMLSDILKTCHPDTLLCIAADITSPGEFIRTRSIGEWKNRIPDLNKRPAIFLLGRDSQPD